MVRRGCRPGLLHQREGLKARHDGGAVVLRALAHVPGIDVAAHGHDFVGIVPAGNVADDVGAVGIRLHVRAHFQMNPHRHLPATRRAIIMASSGEMAAAGIFGCASS